MGKKFEFDLELVEHKKSCSICQEIKPLIDFYARKGSPDGRRADCKSCVSDRSKRYYAQHSGEYKARSREWEKSHPEYSREKSRKWREANPEKMKACGDAWKLANQDAIKEYRKKVYAEKLSNDPLGLKLAARAWYSENKELSKENNKRWNEKNPGAKIVLNAKRRALKVSAEGVFEKADIDQLYGEQSGACKACGKSFAESKYHIDHIVPLSKGGSNWPSNLQLLCPSCNTSKRDHDYETWLSFRKLDWRKVSNSEQVICQEVA